jgi:hypothetical protein
MLLGFGIGFKGRRTSSCYGRGCKKWSPRSDQVSIRDERRDFQDRSQSQSTSVRDGSPSTSSNSTSTPLHPPFFIVAAWIAGSKLVRIDRAEVANLKPCTSTRILLADPVRAIWTLEIPVSTISTSLNRQDACRDLVRFDSARSRNIDSRWSIVMSFSPATKGIGGLTPLVPGIT